MGADRADLAEPRGRETLPGHGDEVVAVEHAEVPAELDGADRNGPGRVSSTSASISPTSPGPRGRAQPGGRRRRARAAPSGGRARRRGESSPRERRQLGPEQHRHAARPTTDARSRHRRQCRRPARRRPRRRGRSGPPRPPLGELRCGPASECHTALSSSSRRGSIMAPDYQRPALGRGDSSPLGCGTWPKRRSRAMPARPLLGSPEGTSRKKQKSKARKSSKL